MNCFYLWLYTYATGSMTLCNHATDLKDPVVYSLYKHILGHCARLVAAMERNMWLLW